MSEEIKVIPAGEIDLRGLNKIEVFRRLWNGSHCQGMSHFGLSGSPMEKDEHMTYDMAEDIWDHYKKNDNMYMDYVYGHIMKVDLSGDSFSPRLYDRDVGEGAAKKIVDKLRKEQADHDSASEAIDIGG